MWNEPQKVLGNESKKMPNDHVSQYKSSVAAIGSIRNYDKIERLPSRLHTFVFSRRSCEQRACTHDMIALVFTYLWNQRYCPPVVHVSI